MGETYRILFCGQAEQCHAICGLVHGDGRYAITSISLRRSPVDAIERAARANTSVEVAIVTAEWLESDAPSLLQPMLDADPRLSIILQMGQMNAGWDHVLSERLMVVPPDNTRSLQLATALANTRRAEDARVGAESQLQSSHRAYQLVSLEFQRQNQRLQEQEERLRVQKDLFETALNNMSQGLCMFDVRGTLVVANRRYRDMYALPEDIVTTGISLRDILSHRKRLGNFQGDPDAYCAELATMMADGEPCSFVGVSDQRIILIVNQPMSGGGWVATHEDITERTKAEEQIRYMARHDSLTGLANRTAFRDEMEHTLRHVRDGDTLAVL
jgi:PAS domain-containing protein